MTQGSLELSKKTSKKKSTVGRDETDANGARVRRSEIPWKDVYFRRGTEHKLKLPKSGRSWAKIYKRYQMNTRNVSEQLGIYLDSSDIPPRFGPTIARSLAKLASPQAECLSPKHVVNYLWDREGPEFLLNSFMFHRTFRESLGLMGPLRNLLAVADEAVYKGAVDLAREISTRETRSKFEEVSILTTLAFLFPDQRTLVNPAYKENLKNPAGNVSWLLGCLSKPKQAQKICDESVYWVAWPMFPTMVANMGTGAANALIRVLSNREGESPADRKLLSKGAASLALIESPEAADYFAQNLEDRSLRKVARAYFDLNHQFCVPALRKLQG
jgi:hypothetical protein